MVSRQINDHIIFSTPAKINIILNIIGKRPDGYHELVMDLIPISLFDRIELLPSQKTGVDLISDLDLPDPESNLLMKTVRSLELETKSTFSFKLHHQKNIPTGAGLGGGSGNAGGLLTVLNTVFNLNIPQTRLVEIATKLGADVPFFLNPTPSIARGLGENLSPMRLEDPFYLLLAYPNLFISTAEAYQGCSPKSEFTMIQHYATRYIQDLDPSVNAFWPHLSLNHAPLRDTLKRIGETNPVYHGMSGSGSTLYGIYTSRKERDSALSELEGKGDWRLFSCEALDEYRYLTVY